MPAVRSPPSALVQRIASVMRSGRFLILGPTNGPVDVPTSLGGGNGSITEAQSAVNLANIADMNSRMAVAFPAQYVSPIANFEANGATTDVTVLGTTYAMVNSTVLSDGIHENATGKGLTCDLIETAIAGLEY